MLGCGSIGADYDNRESDAFPCHGRLGVDYVQRHQKKILLGAKPVQLTEYGREFAA
jgi:hypothetical protein